MSVTPAFMAEFNAACVALRGEPEPVVYERLMAVINKHRQYIAADEESNAAEVREVARKVSDGWGYTLQ